MPKQGLLVVISGPAASGKTTLADRLLSDDIVRAITATTREPRAGEVNGEDYFFLRHEEFQQGIESDHFLEYAEFNHSLYGTPKKQIKDRLREGKVVILVVDPQGAIQIRQLMPLAIQIFILPPTEPVLESRLRGRGTESEGAIRERLNIAKREIHTIPLYDFLVINDDLEAATRDLRDIIRICHTHHIRGGEREAWLSQYYDNWHGEKNAT